MKNPLRFLAILPLLLLAMRPFIPTNSAPVEDAYLWLEEIGSDTALSWVNKQNTKSKDAVEIREFDLEKKAFVENGFFVPEAKTSVCWKDQDTLYIGTDFGPGSLTHSGYPRTVKEWTRGTSLASAKELFVCDEKDMG